MWCLHKLIHYKGENVVNDIEPQMIVLRRLDSENDINDPKTV